jgi:hypothetical protein
VVPIDRYSFKDVPLDLRLSFFIPVLKSFKKHKTVKH